MEKGKKIPKPNVLSIRITDDELLSLEQLSRITNKKISDLMREALQTIAPPRKRCYNNSYSMGGKPV